MNEVEILRKFMSQERIDRIEHVLAHRRRDICVVIDRLDKPHNYMAILRTMDSFGIQDAHIIPFDQEESSSISKKVTQGAHKWLTIHIHKSWQECFKKLKADGYKIMASFLSNEETTIEQLPLDGKIALLFGNELNGLAKEQIAACDGIFMLEMVGFSQSFNVSVACALSLHRLCQKKEAIGIKSQSLSETEISELRLLWSYKSVAKSDKIISEELRRLNKTA